MGWAGQLGVAACYRRDGRGVPGRVGRVNGDAARAVVRNIQPAVGSQRDVPWGVQARVTAGDRRYGGDIPAGVRRKDRDAVAMSPSIPHIGHVDLAGGVHRDTLYVVQRRVAASDCPDGGDVAAGIRRIDGDRFGGGSTGTEIDDVESARSIAGDAPGEAEARVAARNRGGGCGIPGVAGRIDRNAITSVGDVEELAGGSGRRTRADDGWFRGTAGAGGDDRREQEERGTAHGGLGAGSECPTLKLPG